jgi:peroxiredoxin
MGQLIYLAVFLILSLRANAESISLKDYKNMNNELVKIEDNQEEVFLYFWAYWCPTCEDKLNNFFPKNKLAFKIPVITINTDSKIKKVSSFIEKHKIELQVILDSDKVIQRFSKVNGVPAWAHLKKNNEGKFELLDSATGFDEIKVKKILGVK